MKQEFLIHKSQKKMEDPHQKYYCFADDYNGGLCYTCAVSNQMRMYLLSRINLHFVDSAIE